MDYTELENELLKIITLVEKLPVTYREKTYDVLLGRLLKSLNGDTEEHEEEKNDEKSTLRLPVEIKGLLKKQGISTLSEKIFYQEGIYSFYFPKY